MLNARMMVAVLSPLTLILFLMGTSRATPVSVTVQNHSFETPAVPMDGYAVTGCNGDDYITGSPAGWLIFGGPTTDGGQLTLQAGSFFRDKLSPTLDPLDNEQTFWSDGSNLYQMLTEPLRADAIYTLTVDVGKRRDTYFPDGTEIRLGFGPNPGQNLLTPDSMTNPAPPTAGGQRGNINSLPDRVRRRWANFYASSLSAMRYKPNSTTYGLNSR